MSEHIKMSENITSVLDVAGDPCESGTPRKAVVLLSGGIDSATTLAIAKSRHPFVHTLTFRYGQRHDAEVEAARRVAQRMGAASRRVLDIDLRAFGGSALTGEMAVPVNRTPRDMTEIPETYVPARNSIFLAFAVAWAETLGASDIYIGVNAQDHAGYPDCRREYIEAFTYAVNQGTKAGVQGRPFAIHVPLVTLGKSEIIRRGVEFGVDFSLTVSCYKADYQGTACGACDACVLRKEGFEGAGVDDPTVYRRAI